LSDDDVYGVGKVVERPDASSVVERYARTGECKMLSAAEEPPPPPQWPMFTGVLTFPWRLSVLSAWMFISIGLMLTAWLVMFWFGPGAVLGGMSARLFGPPACMTCVLTFGYAWTCCLTIIEETSNGWDRIEVEPSLEWKEWVLNVGRITALTLQAGLVGAAAQGLMQTESWGPLVVGTFAAFPLVLLGALASGEAWVPVGIKTVLWSVRPLWWAWGLFYVETGVLAWGWTLLTAAGLREEPWLTPLYSGPLLSAVMLIYARLLGRLAGCIVRKTSQPSTRR
jgi:hypothetical protein